MKECLNFKFVIKSTKYVDPFANIEFLQNKIYKFAYWQITIWSNPYRSSRNLCFTQKMKIWSHLSSLLKTLDILSQKHDASDAFVRCLFFLLLCATSAGLWIIMCFFYWELWLKWHLRYIYLCFISVRGGYPLWAVWHLGGLQSACFLTVWRNASICSFSMHGGHVVTLPGIYALSGWVGGINEYDWRLDFSSTNSLIAP